MAASLLCQVEPVGRWFEAFIKRRNRNVSASFQELEDEKESSEESEDEEFQLEEFALLKSLDPKDWKVCTLLHKCFPINRNKPYRRGHICNTTQILCGSFVFPLNMYYSSTGLARYLKKTIWCWPSAIFILH